VSIAGKRLDSLDSNDLQALVDNAVPESRTLEYKEAVGTNDAAKKEFLRDVSSFANAAGGDLVIGIRAKNGMAAELVGLPTTQADGEILRFENIIRDGVDPRIPGIRIRAIATPDMDRCVVVIRIPRSFAAPHMVSFQSHQHFFSRHSAGKYPLDVPELRAAFLLADSMKTSLHNFRLERIGRIVADDGPIALLPNPKVVLHLIPLTSLEPSSQIDALLLSKGLLRARFK
jgi:hypothetical protein